MSPQKAPCGSMPISRDLCAWQMPATRDTCAVMAERPVRSSRVEKMSRSRSWRRSPQPPHRRPPAPPPPPLRCAAPAARVVEEPQPVRRFHRGARAGDRVKARRARAAERANPSTAASASASPFSSPAPETNTYQFQFGSAPGPSPFRAFCDQRAAPVQAARVVVDPSSAVQPCGVVFTLFLAASPSDLATLAAVLAPPNT